MICQVFSKKIQKLFRLTFGCMQRFDDPNKEMRSISRADKLCRSNGVGMSKANDLAITEAEGPLGPEAHTDLLGAVNPLFYFIFSIFISNLLIKYKM
jgi:hypothetical protein